MKIKGLLTDRKVLIKALEQMTGEPAVYSGAPSFQYRVGNYIVLRDGSLDAPDDAPLISVLAEQGLIGRINAPYSGITFPLEQIDGRALTNIVNCIAARESLINKAIGTMNAFHVAPKLVKMLNATKPSTLNQFMDIVHECGGESAMRGIRIHETELVFTGFPDTDACRSLAGCIVRSSQARRWTKSAKVEVVNEKYSFRVWLNTIGMKGPSYKEARAALLKNLSGDSAYRTEDLKIKSCQNHKAEEPDFILL